MSYNKSNQELEPLPLDFDRSPDGKNPVSTIDAYEDSAFKQRGFDIQSTGSGQNVYGSSYGRIRGRNAFGSGGLDAVSMRSRGYQGSDISSAGGRYMSRKQSYASDKGSNYKKQRSKSTISFYN